MNITFEEYKGKNKKPNFSSERATSIIKLKARSMVNVLESVPFDLNGEKTKKILSDSGFNKVRRKLGSGLSYKGEYAVGVLPINDSYVIDTFEVVNYTMVGQVELVVEVQSGSSHIVNGVAYPIYTKYYYVNNKPALTRYIKLPTIDGGEDFEIQEIGEVFFFDCQRIPVEVFSNNEDDESDIEYAKVAKALEELSYLDSKKIAEWNRTRTTPYYNENFTSPDLDPSVDTEQVDSGAKTYIVDESYESKVNPGKQMLPATQGTVVLQQHILFIEDDIYKKLSLKRDAIGGNNKHGLEIVLQDENMVNELLALKQIREDHWNSFFSKLGELTKEENENVELKLSALAQSKIDYLNATIAAEQAKSDNKQQQINSGGDDE